MQNQFQVVVPQTQTENGKNVLYVSDLPQNVTEADLWMFFEEYKDKIIVININVSQRFGDYSSGKPNSAKVIFKDTKLADEARKELNMRKIKGKTIRIMWDERDNSLRYNNSTNLFIKNIPFNVKPRDFYEFYAKFGDIASCKMPEDDDGNQLGYGYINYYESESARKAIEATDKEDLWGGKLKAEYFQKKNERSGGFASTNTNVYLKNFPTNYKESDLQALCAPFGAIELCKITTDGINRQFAIVTFKNEDSALKAKTGLNNQKIDESNTLFVDTLMSKHERKKLLSTKINDTNYKLNEQYKFCNLHIRNIPYNAKEEDLTEAFKSFGEIKSVKIDKYMLVTKENNEFVEIPTSKGFGYVCFEDPESAAKAKEQMNGKFLPKFESWKRPLLIDYFMSKNERTAVVNQNIGQFSGKRELMNINPMYGNLQNIHPQMLNQQFFNGMKYTPPQQMGQNIYENQQRYQGNNKPQNKKIVAGNSNTKPLGEKTRQLVPQEKDDIDYVLIDTLDDDNAKKDYLGEFIFKKIENHHLSQINNFPIDAIGKITGMILGIEDINEIIDICRNPDNLTSRISEAMDLLELGRKN